MWRGCHPSALASCPKVSHATVEPQTDVPLQAGDHVTCPNCRVNSIRKEKSLLLGPHGWPQRQRRPPWSGTPFLRAGPWAGCLLGFVTFELHQGHMRWVGLFPQQAGLVKVTWLVSSSWAATRTQVCWLTAPCSSSSNLLHPTCCQPCNQSYCCSGCGNNNSSINPSHVPGALQSKGSFYHHHFTWTSLISSWWERAGNCRNKHGLWISVLAPWGSAEKGSEEGKEAQRSREPSPATLSNLTVSESLSLDFLV